MYAGSTEARRYALGLLLAGLSPEQVETHLEGRLVQREAVTALSDLTNVELKEVVTMAHPTQRGPVEIQGVTTRHNNNEDRTCEACPNMIDIGVAYERVARLDGKIQSYHRGCFEYEFGERRLYGA